MLVADEFEDGWMRGLRLGDLEVRILMELQNVAEFIRFLCRLASFLPPSWLKMIHQSTSSGAD